MNKIFLNTYKFFVSLSICYCRHSYLWFINVMLPIPLMLQTNKDFQKQEDYHFFRYVVTILTMYNEGTFITTWTFLLFLKNLNSSSSFKLVKMIIITKTGTLFIYLENNYVHSQLIHIFSECNFKLFFNFIYYIYFHIINFISSLYI